MYNNKKKKKKKEKVIGKKELVPLIAGDLAGVLLDETPPLNLLTITGEIGEELLGSRILFDGSVLLPLDPL